LSKICDIENRPFAFIAAFLSYIRISLLFSVAYDRVWIVATAGILRVIFAHILVAVERETESGAIFSSQEAQDVGRSATKQEAAAEEVSPNSVTSFT
jgi:hypothetical protein